MNIKERPFETTTVDNVKQDDESWIIGMRTGFSLVVPRGLCREPPETGESVELYGRGFVRGIVIGGRVYRYLTEEQADAERCKLVDEERARRELDERADAAEEGKREP